MGDVVEGKSNKGRKEKKDRKDKNQMMKRIKGNRLRRQRRMLRRQLEFRKRKLKSKVQKERHYQEQSEIDKAMTVGKQEDPCLVSPLYAEQMMSILSMKRIT